VVQVEDLALSDENGEALARDELIHKWKILYVAGADCDTSCQHTLYNIRQINTALGKNADRFQHMIIHLQPMSENFQQLVAEEYPEALHSYASKDSLSQSLPGPGAGDPESNTIYIMDPLGNIMMRFDQGISPKLILKDLNRLLKISRIG
jgi:cytochrome oxidase Cu insertion factor (SCO1/SenC/PrrC family)